MERVVNLKWEVNVEEHGVNKKFYEKMRISPQKGTLGIETSKGYFLIEKYGWMTEAEFNKERPEFKGY